MDGGNFALPKALRPAKKGVTKCEESKKKTVIEDSTEINTKEKDHKTKDAAPKPDPKPPVNESTDTGAKEFQAPVKVSTDPPAKPVEPRKTEPEVAVLQYKEPKWSGPAAFPYTLEVLKSGQIVEEVR